MKSSREIIPTTMFSIERSLHFLAKSGVKDADREENNDRFDDFPFVHTREDYRSLERRLIKICSVGVKKL